MRLPRYPDEGRLTAPIAHMDMGTGKSQKRGSEWTESDYWQYLFLTKLETVPGMM